MRRIITLMAVLGLLVMLCGCLKTLKHVMKHTDKAVRRAPANAARAVGAAAAGATHAVRAVVHRCPACIGTGRCRGCGGDGLVRSG
ncbi:MAG: hypothetical protein ACYTHM_07995 [Planctomycetota bacterium]